MKQWRSKINICVVLFLRFIITKKAAADAATPKTILYENK